MFCTTAPAPAVPISPTLATPARLMTKLLMLWPRPSSVPVKPAIGVKPARAFQLAVAAASMLLPSA